MSTSLSRRSIVKALFATPLACITQVTHGDMGTHYPLAGHRTEGESSPIVFGDSELGKQYTAEIEQLRLFTQEASATKASFLQPESFSIPFATMVLPHYDYVREPADKLSEPKIPAIMESIQQYGGEWLLRKAVQDIYDYYKPPRLQIVPEFRYPDDEPQLCKRPDRVCTPKYVCDIEELTPTRVGVIVASCVLGLWKAQQEKFIRAMDSVNELGKRPTAINWQAKLPMFTSRLDGFIWEGYAWQMNWGTIRTEV